MRSNDRSVGGFRTFDERAESQYRTVLYTAFQRSVRPFPMPDGNCQDKRSSSSSLNLGRSQDTMVTFTKAFDVLLVVHVLDNTQAYDKRRYVWVRTNERRTAACELANQKTEKNSTPHPTPPTPKRPSTKATGNHHNKSEEKEQSPTAVRNLLGRPTLCTKTSNRPSYTEATHTHTLSTLSPVRPVGEEGRKGRVWLPQRERQRIVRFAPEERSQPSPAAFRLLLIQACCCCKRTVLSIVVVPPGLSLVST